MTKILIVEDEAGLRQGLEINLRLESYETVQAGDGEEAIRLFHAENPGLILLDLMLPKRSGFEVLDHIRKVSKVPVILLTARGQETDKVRGLRGGADDYVTKPFGVQELFARIDAVMRRSEVAPAPRRFRNTGQIRYYFAPFERRTNARQDLRQHHRTDRQHAAGAAEPRARLGIGGSDREARELQPGVVREGPHRDLDGQRGGERGRAEARRHH